MARTGERLTLARRALERLDQLAGLAAPSPVERDAAIQRFEFTVGAVWKAAQVAEFAARSSSPSASPRKSCRLVSLPIASISCESSRGHRSGGRGRAAS